MQDLEIDECGFGLAQIKTEGCCSRFSRPDVKEWPGMDKEFRYFFRQKYGTYPRLIQKLIEPIAQKAWDEALFTAASLASLKGNHGKNQPKTEGGINSAYLTVAHASEPQCVEHYTEIWKGAE